MPDDSGAAITVCTELLLMRLGDCRSLPRPLLCLAARRAPFTRAAVEGSGCPEAFMSWHQERLHSCEIQIGFPQQAPRDPFLPRTGFLPSGGGRGKKQPAGWFSVPDSPNRVEKDLCSYLVSRKNSQSHEKGCPIGQSGAKMVSTDSTGAIFQCCRIKMNFAVFFSLFLSRMSLQLLRHHLTFLPPHLISTHWFPLSCFAGVCVLFLKPS